MPRIPCGHATRTAGPALRRGHARVRRTRTPPDLLVVHGPPPPAMRHRPGTIHCRGGTNRSSAQSSETTQGAAADEGEASAPAHRHFPITGLGFIHESRGLPECRMSGCIRMHRLPEALDFAGRGGIEFCISDDGSLVNAYGEGSPAWMKRG